VVEMLVRDSHPVDIQLISRVEVIIARVLVPRAEKRAFTREPWVGEQAKTPGAHGQSRMPQEGH